MTLGPRDSKNTSTTSQGNVNTGGAYDQRGQTVHGDQINVAGDILGDVILKRLDPADLRNQRNHASLRHKVRSFWIDGVLKHSLYNEMLIRLDMETRPTALHNRPWDLILQRPDLPDQSLLIDTPIIDVFDQMNGSLLILGEPGSGKTTLLLELASALLARAVDDPTYPTPIVFNLSSWVIKRQALSLWLMVELCEKYNIPRKAAQQWIEQDQLLPLLDGLDEVQEAHRAACVSAITAFQREHLTPLVVCCRVPEYRSLTQQLTLHGAVSLQPLTESQIELYLVQLDNKLHPLRSLIEQDDELRRLSTSPLLLSIMTLVYDGNFADESSLLHNRRSRLQWLFDAYIRRMFVYRGRKHLYSAQKTARWLRWLARRLAKHSQTLFLMEYMQPGWLSFPLQILLRSLLVVFFVTVICSIIWHVRAGANTTLVLGGLLGAFLGIQDIIPVETLQWSWDQARRGAIDGFYAGAKFGLWLGLVCGLISLTAGYLWLGLGVWLSLVLFFGSIYGVVRGLLAGLNYRGSAHPIVPNQGIHKSLKNAVAVWIISILLLSPVAVLANLDIARSLDVIFISAIVALIYGGQALVAHVALRLLLVLGGCIPIRYVNFLNFACDRIFLRRVGGGYIFIHRLLMEHFASLTDDDIERITAGLDKADRAQS